MNKRLIKKMLKKKQQFHGFIRAEGNNGGDFIEIEDLMDGRVKIQSGSCCVYSIDAIVPVEFLTAILAKTLIENKCDVKKVIDDFDWDEEFKENLKAKVMT